MRLAKRFALLTVVSLLGAAAAYLQSRLLVQFYGAGRVLDMYYLATAAPMAAMTMLGVGGTALLVPLFARNLGPDRRVDDSRGLRFWAAGVVLVALLVSAVASIVLRLWPASWEASGWLALIALGSGAYGLSFYAQAILVAEERPVWFAWAQVLSFVGFIVLLVAARWPQTIQSVSLLYAAGGAVQLVIAALAVALRRRTSESTHPVRVHDFTTHVGHAVFAVIWVVVFMQSASVVDRWFSSLYAVGFVTSYALADKMVQILVSTLAATVGTVVFPRMLEKGRSGGLLTGTSIVAVVLALAPVSAALVVFPQAVVSIAYGGGKFNAEAVRQTADVLALLSLGLLPMGLVFTLPRRLQAVGRYNIQAVIAGVLLGSNLVLKLVLTKTLGAAGVPLSSALAYVVASVMYVAYLFLMRLVHVSREQLVSLAVILIASVGLAVGFRVVFGPGARWWVPALCLACTWGVIGALLWRSLLTMNAGTAPEAVS